MPVQLRCRRNGHHRTLGSSIIAKALPAILGAMNSHSERELVSTNVAVKKRQDFRETSATFPGPTVIIRWSFRIRNSPTVSTGEN